MSESIEVTRGAASVEDVAVLVALLGAGRSGSDGADPGAEDSAVGSGAVDGYRAWRRTRLAALARELSAPE